MNEEETAVSDGYRAIPEPGQLVEVRRRQWVVADVDAGALSDLGVSSQHYVTLSSIDEDGLGETLEVVWEIEPGARIIERAGMPRPVSYTHLTLPTMYCV